jgi:hypothetical protein
MKHAAFSSVTVHGGGKRRSPIGYIQSLRKVGGRNATVGGMAPSACWHGECQRKGPRPGLPLGKQATAQSFLGCDRMTFLGFHARVAGDGHAPTSMPSAERS